MAQRVKPVEKDNEEAYAKYLNQLTLLHQILITSMKARQTTSVEMCAQLRALIDQFEKSYMTP